MTACRWVANGVLPGVTAGRHAAPYFTYFRGLVPISIYCLLLGLLWGKEGRIEVGLALKTPLGRNKVVRLGLFWVVFGFTLVESCLSINQAEVSLSLLSFYFKFVLTSFA